MGNKGVGEININSSIPSRRRNVREKNGFNSGCKRKRQFVEWEIIEIVNNKGVIARLSILKST